MLVFISLLSIQRWLLCHDCQVKIIWPSFFIAHSRNRFRSIINALIFWKYFKVIWTLWNLSDRLKSKSSNGSICVHACRFVICNTWMKPLYILTLLFRFFAVWLYTLIHCRQFSSRSNYILSNLLLSVSVIMHGCIFTSFQYCLGIFTENSVWCLLF